MIIPSGSEPASVSTNMPQVRSIPADIVFSIADIVINDYRLKIRKAGALP